MDIRNKAVDPTTVLHLRGADDELLMDGDKPVEVVLYTPASKPFQRASADKNQRMMDRIQRKGKAGKLSAEAQIEDRATFLAGCTKEFRNLEYGDITESEHLAKAVYGDTSIGFIADQVEKHLGDWANFLPSASKA